MHVILIWIDLIKEWVLSGKWWKVDNSSPKSLSKTQIITVIKKMDLMYLMCAWIYSGIDSTERQLIFDLSSSYT